MLGVALLISCSGAVGYHAARPAMLAPARCAPMLAQRAASPPPSKARSRWLAPALVASSVILKPALALASASGEHLHLGQKIALFFKGERPRARRWPLALSAAPKEA